MSWFKDWIKRRKSKKNMDRTKSEIDKSKIKEIDKFLKKSKRK